MLGTSWLRQYNYSDTGHHGQNVITAVSESLKGVEHAPYEEFAVASRIVNNILELVGNTPLVRINRMNPVPGVELLVKLESMNPGGSVKDRIGLRMIEQAEASRRADAGQDRAGGQQRQHGHRPGHGLRGQGLPARWSP